jgi:hypothetical protein
MTKRAARTAIALLLLLAAAPAARGQDEPARLRVAVTPAVGDPVIGAEYETGLRIEVTGPGPSTVAPPRLFASVGRVAGLERAGERSFKARYIFPLERYPQAAIVAAELEEAPARGFAVIRLHAPASPGFRTEPGASVTLRVGGREFGPQIADRQGQVRVSVVVPPGVTAGVARSVGRNGQATEQTVDLDPPVFPRLLILRPDALAAGAVAALSVFAVDPSGVPAESTSIILQCSCGRPQPLGGDPGQNRFLIRAPASTAEGRLFVTAILRGQPETETEAGIPLVPAPAAELALHPDRAHLPIGSGIDLRVFVTARDLYGNPARLDQVELFIDGTAAEKRTLPDGRVAAVVPAPARYSGRDRVQIEAVLDGRYARQEVALSYLAEGDEEADDPPVTLTPRLGVLWTFAHAPGAALSIEALHRSPWGSPRLELGVAVGYLRNGVTASDTFGISEVVIDEAPLLGVLRWRLLRGRPVELGLGGGAGVALARATLTSIGAKVTGQAIALALQASADIGLRVPGGRLLVGGRYLHTHLGRLSSGDTVAGNSAGLVVEAGYRVGF